MRKLTFALGAAALAIAGAAFAQPSTPAHDGAQRHQHGPMTRADAEARADKLFARLDANGDGKLDRGDRAARQDKRFARLDTDGNGAISRDEFTAAAGKRFAEKAQGQDGHRAGHRTFQGRNVAWRGHRGRGHGALAMAGKMADTNRDGAISKDEFKTAALAMFDRADANRDGTITPDERKQMRDQHREHRGQHRREPATVTG